MDLDFFHNFELVRRLAVATLVGLLVGVERGWRERKAESGTRTAGIRTFTLIGLLGGVVGLIAHTFADKVAGAVVIGITFLAFAGVFATFRMRENIHDKSFGFTTVAAAMSVFVLGAYALLGDPNIAAAAGVVVMVALISREQLHGLLEKVTWQELRAAVILLVMTFLALPFIPDANFGPYGGINPRQVWLLAVVLAAVSFLGYIGVKVMGPQQGTLIASAAGGLVSSTAVTLAAGQRAAADQGGARVHAAGVAVATAVSLLRTLVLIFFLNKAVVVFAAGPLIAGAAVGLVAGLLLAQAQSRKRNQAGLTLRNPFSFHETLLLALIIGVITFATQAAAAWFGTAGGLITAAVSGAVDVDAATISLTRLGGGTITPLLAALGILAAVGTNNLFKYSVGSARGGSKFAVYLLGAIGLPMAALAAAAAGVVLWSKAFG